MSISNTFNFRRFMLLYRQQLLQNSRLLIFGTIGYCGIILIIVGLMTLDNQLKSPNPQAFFPLMSFLTVSFGVLYTGYSFPSLRTKESTISYITLPASTLEKFLLEFINRIILAAIMLPILYWFTYNAGNYFMSLIFQRFEFQLVGVTVMENELHKLLIRP
ncbi:MAG: hypothetical protein AAFO69_20050, partial [Bacteroidota bacterium]